MLRLKCPQLSKEDEAAVGADETEVRREDQDKINRFSRLHQREMLLEEELKTKAVTPRPPHDHTLFTCLYLPQKDKEDLDEISTELELADEDDKIPYKIGDSFFSLSLPEVQQLLASSTEKIEEEVSAVQEKLGGIREEMGQLKVVLYARFGRSINLET